MRYIIIFAVAYFIMKVIRKMLSQVKIVDRDGVDIKDQAGESNPRLKVDESEIEDADFKEVD